MMKAWKIVLRGQVVDTVFYDAAITAETVQRQLIDKDGFDPEIEVSPSRIPNWLDDENQESADYVLGCGEENLVELALDQIKKDVEKGDLTALEVLLYRVPQVTLQAFLSECW
jgi:hypothetical protein